jgi:hypothetical protein
MCDAGTLRFLGCFRLRLRCCSHEGDQRVANGALHGVLMAPSNVTADHYTDECAWKAMSNLLKHLAASGRPRLGSCCGRCGAHSVEPIEGMQCGPRLG